MSIAALVHIFVYPATPYVQVAKAKAEEHHGTVARVKENIHDVIFEGGEDVSSLYPKLLQDSISCVLNFEFTCFVQIYVVAFKTPILH